jgi:hypothetical protein
MKLTRVTETGGLFRLLFRLMDVLSPLEKRPNLLFLTTLLGRHFGIRDDYMNLCSDAVSSLII